MVQRREGATSLTLRGCLLHVVTADHSTTIELSTYTDWRAVFERLGLSVADVTETEWQSLWTRTLASHQVRDAAGRP